MPNIVTKMEPGSSIVLTITEHAKPGDTIEVVMGKDKGGRSRKTAFNMPEKLPSGEARVKFEKKPSSDG